MFVLLGDVLAFSALGNLPGALAAGLTLAPPVSPIVSVVFIYPTCLAQVTLMSTVRTKLMGTRCLKSAHACIELGSFLERSKLVVHTGL